MTKALTKKEEKQLAAYGDLMDDAAVSGSDIIIPKILLMQAMSNFVKDEKARSGEYRGSLGCEKIADKGEGFEAIPFKMYKTWITLTTKGNEFVRQEPFTVENAGWPRDEIIDGKECNNYEAINYYVLLPSEIAEGSYMPHVMTFRSTGYIAGKTLETHRVKMKEFGKPLCFKTFQFSSELREKDGNSWYVPTVTPVRDTEDKELEAVKHWMNVIKQSQVRVDDSEFSGEASEEEVEVAHEI